MLMDRRRIGSKSLQVNGELNVNDLFLEIRGKGLNQKDYSNDTRYQVQEDKHKTLHKHLEKRQNFQQLSEYNPWGKPGGGAPIDSTKKLKFLETQMPILSSDVSASESAIDTFFKFGKPGNGAPQVTKSGRIRTQLTGDPVIRFQESQNVHKSIENGIRYFEHRDIMHKYHKDLDYLVSENKKTRQEEQQMEKLKEHEHLKRYPFGRSLDRNHRSTGIVPDPIFTCTSLSARSSSSLDNRNDDVGVQNGYHPWGKGFGTPVRDAFGNSIRLSPRDNTDYLNDNLELTIPMGKYSGGDGSPHLGNNNSLIITKLPRTLKKEGVKDIDMGRNYLSDDGNCSQKSSRERQTFMERLGWTEDQKTVEKTQKGKRVYLQHLKEAMSERHKAKRDEQNECRREGIELAQIIREKRVERPKRDSSTGLLIDQKLLSTDVTKRLEPSINKLPWNVADYQTTLAKQAEERHLNLKKEKEREEIEAKKHFEAFSTFWNKPGHGAPNHPENHRKEGIDFINTNNRSQRRITPIRQTNGSNSKPSS